MITIKMFTVRRKWCFLTLAVAHIINNVVAASEIFKGWGTPFTGLVCTPLCIYPINVPLLFICVKLTTDFTLLVMQNKLVADHD